MGSLHNCWSDTDWSIISNATDLQAGISNAMKDGENPGLLENCAIHNDVLGGRTHCDVIQKTLSDSVHLESTST